MASHCTDVFAAEKRLEHAMEDFYALFLKLLALFPALARMDSKILELKKGRMLPTEEDLKPNYKFSENRLIQQLDNNPLIEKAVKNNAVGWDNDLDQLFLKPFYTTLRNQDFYTQYLKSGGNSYEEDKNFVLQLIEMFLLENEECAAYLGEIRLHWKIDYNDAIIAVYNVLKKYNEKQAVEKPLPPLFKPTPDSPKSEDEIFMRDLFVKTITDDKEYEQIIAQCIRNWELDRIANMDLILLKMALCELMHMPSIPIRVTMNEYIELAKYYSTPKSRIFINGVLDNALNMLRTENRMHKQGRGLMG
ncbi:MAG: transcription antitermination factor NusB [Bacteroidales bacterium]|nr:transcription antitermination factor NusB [Bacteroidales bacterium]